MNRLIRYISVSVKLRACLVMRYSIVIWNYEMKLNVLTCDMEFLCYTFFHKHKNLVKLLK